MFVLKEESYALFLSLFSHKAVGFNFLSIFGMTLSGLVGIEASVSHHTAGG